MYSSAMCFGSVSNKRESALRFSFFNSRAFFDSESEKICMVAVALRTYMKRSWCIYAQFEFNSCLQYILERILNCGRLSYQENDDRANHENKHKRCYPKSHVLISRIHFLVHDFLDLEPVVKIECF